MTTEDSSNRIYLEDLDADVRLLKRTLVNTETAREKKYEAILSDIVKVCMDVFTHDYIKKKIICARIEGKSTARLISKKYLLLENYLDYDSSRVFYRCIGDAKESLESRIKSFIDTTSMIVTFDHDTHHDHIVIDISWGHYLYQPIFCLRRPFTTFAIVFLLAFFSFVFLLILSISTSK